MIGDLYHTLQVMSGLLNTLLDVDLMETGACVPISPVSLASILTKIEHNFSEHAARTGVTWNVVPSRGVVLSDPALLERMLTHLIVNAFKYAPSGMVLVGCRRQGPLVRLEVWDNGIGIPEDQQDKIFEPFYQVENAQERWPRGVGLGLAIVRRQAVVVGHHLGMRSWPDRGSVFWIEVPRAPDEPVSRPAVARANKGRAFLPRLLDHTSLLVIQEESLAGGGLPKLIVDQGSHVTVVRTRSEALISLGHAPTPPDLVIVDQDHPGSRIGMDVLKSLKDDLPLLVPTLLVTEGRISAHVHEPDFRIPDAILTRPFRNEDLASAVGALLSPSSAPPLPLRPPLPTVFVMDDDAPLCEVMAMVLNTGDPQTDGYAHAAAFMKAHSPFARPPALVDVVMPGMNGIALMRWLRTRGDPMPVLVMSGQGNVTMAVATMARGAEAFLLEPLDLAQMLAAVARVLAVGPAATPADAAHQRIALARLARLTLREQDVLDQLLFGSSNKMIAHILNISQRTVENHRAALMRKTESKSLLDLFRTLMDAGRISRRGPQEAGRPPHE
ncbi:ATP-binding protein [Pararhodospirillum photometricum]|nr:ATP-binding protein [Pararhodospirillum photometricum]